MSEPPRIHIESVEVDVDPLTVYEAVSHPERIGRWSPEARGAVVRGAVVPGEESPAYVGMHFTGQNERGRLQWRSRCVVVAADPGARFAFEVNAVGFRMTWLRVPVALWDFRMRPSNGGTHLTQTWADRRPRLPAPLMLRFDKMITGGQTRAARNAATMRETLQRLKADLESSNPESAQ